MTKSAASRHSRSNKGAGINSQKFIDPLAFAAGNSATPSSTWMLDPANESFDHINIHSESNHPLGRWFNPRSTQSFPMGSLGSFNSIEAYMYFLLANSMRITEPDVIARVDALRLASTVMLGGATLHLPNDLRQAYAHTYRLPDVIYKNIIGYVADAYMSKLYVVAQNSNKPDILETDVAIDILANRLPYFGYYINKDGVTMNVSQRTTIISAIKLMEHRLREEKASRAKSNTSTMRVALLKAGVDKLVPDNEAVHFGKKPVEDDHSTLPDVSPESYAQFRRKLANNSLSNVEAMVLSIRFGLSVNGQPASEEALAQFRTEAENDLKIETTEHQKNASDERNFHNAQIATVVNDEEIDDEGGDKESSRQENDALPSGYATDNPGTSAV